MTATKNNDNSAYNPLRSVKHLPCPICNALNPVSAANISLRCRNCGTQLLSVKVKKQIGKNKLNNKYSESRKQ